MSVILDHTNQTSIHSAAGDSGGGKGENYVSAKILVRHGNRSQGGFVQGGQHGGQQNRVLRKLRAMPKVARWSRLQTNILIFPSRSGPIEAWFLELRVRETLRNPKREGFFYFPAQSGTARAGPHLLGAAGQRSDDPRRTVTNNSDRRRAGEGKEKDYERNY